MALDAFSPQAIGREFVRQYYTLLNEGPAYLYRFYSSESSFFHGHPVVQGEDVRTVKGQTDISKRIQELNFKDCRTKIHLVDSQETVGTSLVVQVLGELSNNRGPMRRFMQTFVLAQHHPKQFYVHNDIFRYQDAVLGDLLTNEDTEEYGNTQSIKSKPVLLGKPALVPTFNEIPVQAKEEPSTPAKPAPVLKPSPPQPKQELPVTPANQQPSVSPVKPELTPSKPSEETVAIPEPAKAQPEAVPAAQNVEPVVTNEIETVEPDSSAQEAAKPCQTEPTKSAVTESKEQQSVEPKSFSWASVAGKAPTASVAVVSPMNKSGGPMNASKPPAVSLAVETPAQPQPAVSAPKEPKPVTQNKPTVREEVKRPAAARPPFDDRKDIKYPDNQQVFVGNLPIDVKDEELKPFFSKWGTVLELRIRTSPQNKIPFGFVVFDSPEPVKTILSQGRIDWNGHRVNVEEKKPRNPPYPKGARADRVPDRGTDRPFNRPPFQNRGGSAPRFTAPSRDKEPNESRNVSDKSKPAQPSSGDSQTKTNRR